MAENQPAKIDSGQPPAPHPADTYPLEPEKLKEASIMDLRKMLKNRGMTVFFSIFCNF